MTQEAVKALSDAELAQVITWEQDEIKTRTEQRKQEAIAKIKALTIKPCLFSSQVTARPIGDGRRHAAFIEGRGRIDGFEFGMGFKKLPDGPERIVVLPVRAAVRRARQAMHDAVGRDDIGTRRHHRPIDFQFLKHVIRRVVGIEHDEHGLAFFYLPAHLRHDVWRGRAAINEGDEGAQRMGVERGAVIRAKLKLHANDAAPAHGLAEAGEESLPAAVRHAGFDDHIRLQLPHDFLDTDHVFRELDDRTAEPRESIGILAVITSAQPSIGHEGKA